MTTLSDIRRVVILGPGGAGKSTLARQLGVILKLPVVELDKVFWRGDLTHSSLEDWAEAQRTLVIAERWIMDGDLGSHDVLEPRLARADMILFLEVSLMRRAWRAALRSWERWDFWVWLVAYDWQFRPIIMRAIREHGGGARFHHLRGPGQSREFLAELATARDDALDRP